MMLIYMLVLVISAALLGLGLGWAGARLCAAFGRPPLPAGVVALGVTACLCIVVAAPAWLFAALVLLAVLLVRMPAALPVSPEFAVLLALLPLMLAPLAGAPAGLALDAALVAAALLGERYAA